MFFSFFWVLPMFFPKQLYGYIPPSAVYEIWHCIHVLSNSWYCKIYSFLKYGTSDSSFVLLIWISLILMKLSTFLQLFTFLLLKLGIFIFSSCPPSFSFFLLSFSFLLPFPSLFPALFSLPTFFLPFSICRNYLVWIAVLFWLHELRYFRCCREQDIIELCL